MQDVQPSQSPSAASPDLRVLQEDENYRVVAHENILIILWRRTPEAEACHAVYDLGVSLAQSLGTEKISVTSVLPPRVPAPSAPARSALADLHEDSHAVVHRTAVVLADTGFVAAAVRSIILSATQRSARRKGHGVFSSLGSAMTWATEGLATASGRSVSIPALLSALEQMRSSASQFDPSMLSASGACLSCLSWMASLLFPSATGPMVQE